MKNLFILFLIGVCFIFFNRNTSNNDSNCYYVNSLGKFDNKIMKDICFVIDSVFDYNTIISGTYNINDYKFASENDIYDVRKIINKIGHNKKTLILTEKQITVDNRVNLKYFGAGSLCGNVCVVSSFNLKKNVTNDVLKERLKKVTIHEIGHNIGIKHCNNKNCIMCNDVKIDDQKIYFCNNCKKQIHRY